MSSGRNCSSVAELDAFRGDQPSVWHQFSGNSDATFFNGDQRFDLNDRRTKTYGEVAGILNIFGSSDSQVSGFLKPDYRFGKDMSGYGVRAGFRIGFGGKRVVQPVMEVAPELPAPVAPATQTCADGTVILATDLCPTVPVAPPEAPLPAPERG